MATTITVSSQSQLNSAIEQADTASGGTFDIVLSADITEGQTGQPAGLYALDLASGVSVTIDGGGHTISGLGTNGGIAVIGGRVSISDLTIEDTIALGGTGSGSGGGGAAVGGGLFVGPQADVSLHDVLFRTDAAQGGAGGHGGNGGTGGHSSLIIPQLGTVGANGLAGAAGVSGTGGTPTTGGTGGPGKPGAAGGVGRAGGRGGAGGAGGNGGFGTSAATHGFRGGHGGAGGTGGIGGLGGAGGNGGAGGKGGKGGNGAFPSTFAARGPFGSSGGTGGNGGTGKTGGYGAGGGGGGQGGQGGIGGQGALGGMGHSQFASSHGTTGYISAGGTGGTGGGGGQGGKGGAGGAGNFGGGGGGGGRGGAAGAGGPGGTGGTGGRYTRTSPPSTSPPPPPQGGAGGRGGTGGVAGTGGIGGHGGTGGFGGGGGGAGKGGAGGAAGAAGKGGLGGISRYLGAGSAGNPGPNGSAGNAGVAGSPGPTGVAGAGGFGGGAGSATRGGGGLGAGGGIFVAQGGILTFDGGLVTGSSVAGGSGANQGQAYGAGIFIQGDETLTLAATSAVPLTIANEIADQRGVGGTAGAGDLVIQGSGTVDLSAANTFVGGITIDSGTLELGHPGAAGSGPIGFAHNGGLMFAATNAPAVPVTQFATGDTIVVGNFLAVGSSYTGGTLTLTSLPNTVTLNIPGHMLSDFTVTDDPLLNETLITAAAPCFCAGTLVRTVHGELPVEHLRPGDQVHCRGRRGSSGALDRSPHAGHHASPRARSGPSGACAPRRVRQRCSVARPVPLPRPRSAVRRSPGTCASARQWRLHRVRSGAPHRYVFSCGIGPPRRAVCRKPASRKLSRYRQSRHVCQCPGGPPAASRSGRGSAPARTPVLSSPRA